MAGTPDNTRRAYARDLAYLAAWKEAAFAAPLIWPETEAVALRFLLDHARDLETAPPEDPARIVAERMVALGLRLSLARPAPATLDRRIASWRAFHRMRNLPSPFEAPLLRQTRAKARKASGHLPRPKSAHPITREILIEMIRATGPGLRGLRDRAVLCLGWASGGRRRSEIAGLMREDLDLTGFDAEGIVRLRLVRTKTTGTGTAPRLVLKGMAARALVAWLDAGRITEGPVFRRITRTGTVGACALSPAGVGQIVKRLVVATGRGGDFASAHGLRAGFLTQAALDGVPVQAAMRLSLHRSALQAQKYYADVEIAANPAADLLERGTGEAGSGETGPLAGL
ncbi:MAG: integrase [Rubellimicrobium sp.]|nr:integrase [Rubellimicrobium sp.]